MGGAASPTIRWSCSSSWPSPSAWSAAARLESARELGAAGLGLGSARSARACARLAFASARRDVGRGLRACRSARSRPLALAFRAAATRALALAAALAAARCRRDSASCAGRPCPCGLPLGGRSAAARGARFGGRGPSGRGGLGRRDPRGDPLLDRGPLGLQLGVSALVGGHIIGGRGRDGASLDQQPVDVGGLRRGPAAPSTLVARRLCGRDLAVRRDLPFQSWPSGPGPRPAGACTAVSRSISWAVVSNMVVDHWSRVDRSAVERLSTSSAIGSRLVCCWY